MLDLALLKKKMVEEQIISRGIEDRSVLYAFYKVDRHRFVPEELKENAYSDYPLPIGEGQTISQPYMVALMTESLKLTGSEKVLEIGTGSGYQAAILSLLSAQVYTIERFPALAQKAGAVLKELGYNNVQVKVDDGTLGWKEQAPFDRIIITAASEHVPLPLMQQLKDGGIMIAPLGGAFSQMLTIIENKNGKFQTTPICGCVFVPLVGKHASKIS